MAWMNDRVLFFLSDYFQVHTLHGNPLKDPPSGSKQKKDSAISQAKSFCLLFLAHKKTGGTVPGSQKSFPDKPENLRQVAWWAVLDSNRRLPPCEDGTLPLS